MVGGSAMGIGITMFLRDQFSGPAARVRNSAQVTSEEIRRMQEQQLRSQRNMYAGLAMGGAMAIRGMGRVVKEAAQFGYEMEFVKQISSSTVQQQKALTEQSMSLGQATIFTSQNVAEGMRFMAMAGMKANEISGNISAAVNLAAAANLQVAGRGGAADIMTNVMKSFNKSADESSYVADILAQAATNANTNIFELGEALKYAGSTSMDLNISLEESIAMAMTLANAGIQGSMAGVAMENSMRYLSRTISSFASGTQVSALEAAGLTGSDFMDANGNINSMVQNIGVLKKAMEGMGNVEKQAILQTLFGVRGKRAGSLLMRNYDEFMGHLTVFQSAHGRATDISMGMMDTLEGSFKRLQVSWKNLGIYFTQAIEPILRPILWVFEKIAIALQAIFKTPVLGAALAAGMAGFIVIKTVSWAYLSILKGIQLATMLAGSSTAAFTSTAAAGYNAAAAAASRYAAAASFSGVAGAGGMMGFSRKAFRGTGGYIVRTQQGGYQQFKSASAAAKAARGVGTKRAVANSAAFGLSRMAAGTGTRALMGGVLGKLLGFLGGPVGLALSFALPAAIGGLTYALKNNKEATDRSVEAQKRKEMQDQVRYTRMGHMIQFQDNVAPELSVIGRTQAGHFTTRNDSSMISSLTDKLEKLIGTPSMQPINIYVDNELQVQKIIERNTTDALRSFGQ